MKQILNSSTCILIKNLDEINYLEKFKLNLNEVYFFCKDYDLSDHFKYSEKYKIAYSKKVNIYNFIKTQNIDSIIFTYLNEYSLNEANFISDNFKSTISKIGFFVRENFYKYFSSNFYYEENDTQDFWNWNYGEGAISNIKLTNYFPFEVTFSCEVRWPSLIKKDNKIDLNRLIDNENNIVENYENRKFIYFCDGFGKKDIKFYFEKNKIFEEDPRNLNFNI